MCLAAIGFAIAKETHLRAVPPIRLGLPEEAPKKFRKDPRKALRAFPAIPLESTAGTSQALLFKAFEASRAFPDFSPPQYGCGPPLFQKWFRRGPLRAGHGVPSSTGGISEIQTLTSHDFLCIALPC